MNIQYFFPFEENRVFWINIKYFFLFEAKKFAFQINLKFKSFFMKITYLLDKFKSFSINKFCLQKYRLKISPF